MSQLPDFLPESATPENLNQAMAWTKRTLEATRIQGFGLTREIAKQVCLFSMSRSYQIVLYTNTIPL